MSIVTNRRIAARLSQIRKQIQFTVEKCWDDLDAKELVMLSNMKAEITESIKSRDGE